MRRLPSVVSAALCLALTTCGGGAERTEIVVYSAHGQDLLAEMEQGFEALHPDVDVVWQDMGADAAYDRVRAERENPRADVWWGGLAYRYAQAAEAGLLHPHRPSWHEHVPEHAHDPEWRWVGQFLMPQVIAFNEDRVTEPPADWSDLATPAWKGRVVLRDPGPSGGMKAIFGALFERGERTGEDPRAWLEGVAANLHSIAPNPAKMYDTVRRDDAGLVTVWNLTDVLYQSQEADPRVPFGWVAPTSGVPLPPDCIALVARPDGTVQPEAIAFYEYVTGTETAGVLAEKHKRFLVRDDVPRPAWAEGLDLPPMDVDWNTVGARLDEWIRVWEDVLAR